MYTFMYISNTTIVYRFICMVNITLPTCICKHAQILCDMHRYYNYLIIMDGNNVNMRIHKLNYSSILYIG